MRPKNLFTALSLLTVCSLGALTTGGCVDNRTTLFINGVAYFAPGDECDPDISLSGSLLVSGNYNPITQQPYYAWLVVANGLQPLGNNNTLRPETSRIQLEGAEIQVDAATGGAAAPAYTVNFVATIHPDESEDPGVGVVPVPIVPPSLGLPLDADYQVGITLFGETLGGTKVESGEFRFPLRVVQSPSLTTCGTFATLPEGSTHPCGLLAQDGYLFPCGEYPGTAGCEYCLP